ncbi:MAG TPA: DUF4157 domain-containing protein [Blastocatellia bacterium]|nr:DUF4157 domain-containing protein [Blastocatellia bacterium]
MKEAAAATQETVVTPAPAPERETVLQRKCACGGGAAGIVGVCKECDRKLLTLPRYSLGRPMLFQPASSIVAASASGRGSIRGHAQARFAHHTFSNIRVHSVAPRKLPRKVDSVYSTDSAELDQAVERIPGLSFQEPQQFRKKQAEPAGGSQDRATDEMKAATGTANSFPVETARRLRAGDATSSALIVEDDALEVGPGQMRKSDFLDELEAAVRALSEAELGKVGRTAQGCPYIENWIGYYRTRGSQHIERALRRYAPEAAGAAAARDYVSLAGQRVRRAVIVWARTGRITGVPEEAASLLPGMELRAPGIQPGTASAISSGGLGVTEGIARAFSGAGGLFSKGRGDEAHEDADPQKVQTEFGSGAPLDSRVRAQMETAFVYNFSHVRVHTDAKAAALSANLNARAFTIEKDIAFAPGEYQPGTLFGDALIAHELAHVVQQGKQGPGAAPMAMEEGHGVLEQDADEAAAGAVAGIWGGAKGKLINIRQNALPRLRSGLRLSRCKTECPTRIEMARLHTIRFDGAALARGIRTGIGAVAEMVVSDPTGRDWKDKQIREKLTPGSNTCGSNVPNCGNVAGVAGGELARFSRGPGSVFTVGREFSDPNFSLPLPARRNTFYDAHIFLSPRSELHDAGLRSCEQSCQQIYECPGAGQVGATTYFIDRSFNRGVLQGVNITNVNVSKVGIVFSGGSRPWSDVLR